MATIATWLAMTGRHGGAAGLPRHCGDHGADVDAAANALARRDPAEVEALIARLSGEAISRWRLDDATFWQRVKFRTRLIRASGSAPTQRRA